MIRIYSYKEYIIQDFRRIIFPLLLDVCFLHNKKLEKYYELVSEKESADVVIIPVDIKYFYKNNKVKLLEKMISEARVANKPVWVYSAGDRGKTIDDEVYNFRFGGFDSKLNDRTFILPAFFLDPYKKFFGMEFSVIEKDVKPQIGFVGHADGSALKFFLEFYHYLKVHLTDLPFQSNDTQKFFPSGIIRYKKLKELENDPRINTDFIFRKKYRAGVKNGIERERTELDFFLNIKNNPYTFCMRGAGNFSVRFFETLAMGRIPVLVETDSRLPLEWMDWRSNYIISDKTNLVESILNFHEKLNEDEFQQIQLQNRKFWLDNLSLDSYFIQIHHYFKNKLES